MDRSFRGEYTFKVDRKGRMSIPAEFRRTLEQGDPDFAEGERPKFIIVYGGKKQRQLVAYTVEEARALAAKIERLPNSGLKRRLIRENISCSINSEIDPDGRLVIPQTQREKIGLTAEAKFVGALSTFEIWDPDAYEEHLEMMEEDEDLGVDVPDGMSALDALDRVLANQEQG